MQKLLRKIRRKGGMSATEEILR